MADGGGVAALSRITWPGLSQYQATYALKVALTVVLTLFVAFLFDLNHTYWALMTVPLIVRPEAGTMVWRSTARMAGTFAGGLAGFAIALCFAQSAPQAIGATAVLLFLVGYLTRMESGIDAYGYATCGFTALVIVLDAQADPTLAWPLTLARLTETMIPIVCGFVVMLTVFPRTVSDNAATAIQRARGAVRGLSDSVLAEGPLPSAAPEKDVIGAIGMVHTELRSLVYERSRKDWGRPWMANVAHELDRVSVSLTAVRFASEHAPDGVFDLDRVQATRAQLRDLAGRILSDDDDAPTLLDMGDEVEALADRIHNRAMEDTSDLPVAVLEQALADLAGRLAALARATAFLKDANLAQQRRPNAPRHTPSSRRYRDHLAAVQFGLRPAIMLVVVSTLWLSTGWNGGNSLAMIVAALSLLLPTIVPRPVRVMAGKALALGLFAGLCIAAGLMTALTHVEGFPALAILMGTTVFVIFYLCGAIQLLPLAIGSMIMISIGLQPSNTPNFHPATLFNVAATMALLPPAFIVAITVVFPENHAWLSRHLRRGTTRLLRRTAAERRHMPRFAFFDEIIDMFTDYASGLSAEKPEDARLIRRTRAALVAGLACDRLRNSAQRLPPATAALIPGMRAALRDAVSGRTPDMTPFDRLRDAARHDADRPTRICLLEAETLRPLIESGILSPVPQPSGAA
ncbi:FUSC family protein [Falsirhodobacter sp. 20TX0035]|uniref:FUSC family protein n=1 Tax=Falsirhodobacter sp. 20TX0035 TaxID=3022019 RepID=UPI00232F5947|nr:FUSC family protein [Falsirhodobacter sp. 20TX0035]MDB6454825.1 FUSC family protein [Falsirhodobacter sp. 20TX0035]